MSYKVKLLFTDNAPNYKCRLQVRMTDINYDY